LQEDIIKKQQIVKRQFGRKTKLCKKKTNWGIVMICGAGTAFTSGAPAFTPGFSGVSFASS
jgi:hypothetical protein